MNIWWRVIMRNRYAADPVVAAIEAGMVLTCQKVLMGSGWVSDELQEVVKSPSWDCNRIGLKGPVIINAPTGLGKNTFVQNVLANHAAKQNKYVLLLTNRYTLNLQQKQDLSDSNDHPPFGTSVIDEEKNFGKIITLLYHEVPSNLKWLVHTYPIGYVVFDEVHFFCSDATFNTETERIFRMILDTYPVIKRIYMSATPEDVRPLIAYEEKCLYQRMLQSPGSLSVSAQLAGKGYGITEYYFPRDYSFVKLHFFAKWESLEELVGEPDSDEKWLIFVSSKDIGVDLKKRLANSEFIDASYKNLNPEGIQELARLRKFNQKVLIATTVLYNGFSFEDDKLKNIVVDSADRVEVLQMLGRKRLNGNETVNLYVMEKGPEEISKYKRICAENYHILQEFSNNPDYFCQNRLGTLNESQQLLFTIDQNHTVWTNHHAPYQLACLSGKYERLEDRFSREGDTAFFDEVCRWFDIQYDPDMSESLDEKVKKQIIDFTEQYVDQPMDGDKFKQFVEQLMKIIEPLKHKMNRKKKNSIRDTGKYSGANVKNIFKFFELPYRCKKTDNLWTISKVTDSSDDDDDDDTEE